MKIRKAILLFLILLLSILATTTLLWSHDGGLEPKGGNQNRKTGEYLAGVEDMLRKRCFFLTGFD